MWLVSVSRLFGSCFQTKRHDESNFSVFLQKCSGLKINSSVVSGRRNMTRRSSTCFMLPHYFPPHVPQTDEDVKRSYLSNKACLSVCLMGLNVQRRCKLSTQIIRLNLIRPAASDDLTLHECFPPRTDFRSVQPCKNHFTVRIWDLLRSGFRFNSFQTDFFKCLEFNFSRFPLESSFRLETQICWFTGGRFSSEADVANEVQPACGWKSSVWHRPASFIRPTAEF